MQLVVFTEVDRVGLLLEFVFVGVDGTNLRWSLPSLQLVLAVVAVVSFCWSLS